MSGPVPATLTREFTPLGENYWSEEMRMYGFNCINMDSLTFQLQQLIIKRFIKESLLREVNLLSTDGFFCSVKKVLATFEEIHPALLRKVTFMDLLPLQGERTAVICRRMGPFLYFYKGFLHD